MPAFVSPLVDPGSWTLSLPADVPIPPALRYGGYTARGLRAQRMGQGDVAAPTLTVLRSAPDADGRTFVELQVNPFPIRRVVRELSFGLPTFYVVFDPGDAPVAFSDWDTATAGEVLGSVGGVTLLCCGQDRVVRDPGLWAREIAAAIDRGGGDVSAWEPFAAAVESETASGPDRPVLLLDHTGTPRRAGAVEIDVAGDTRAVPLDPADRGDLQRAVARLHAASPASMPFSNLFGAGGPVTVRPLGTGAEFQVAILERGAVDAAGAAGEIAVTLAERHITYTNLHGWFAEQFAQPDPPFEQLARFRRGNTITPFVNGRAFFDELFHRLEEARKPGGGLHLANFAVFPDAKLAKARDGDPDDFAVTLTDAAKRIGAAQRDGTPGGCRVLSVQVMQLEPGSTVEAGEILIFHLLVSTILILSESGVDPARTDAAGMAILFALIVINALLVAKVFDEGGAPMERNKAGVDTLNEVERTSASLSKYPARIEDNPRAPAEDDFPFDVIFSGTKHFGVYHQKFGIVNTTEQRIGYCGGIDVNPNRLDDARHLAKGPYHDVHVGVVGPAVRDLELSFAERWSLDGGGEDLAFQPETQPETGTDAVQIGRTYFASADPARAFDFAPDGDATIERTLLQAIGLAREYIFIEDQYFTPPPVYADALVAKVANREIKQLVIVLPMIGDQPLGDHPRSEVISRLRTADAGRGIVRVGYPRRHYTVPDNQLRASSGRCLLKAPIDALPPGTNEPIYLGPIARLPQPPFWVAIEGELMYAFDESTAPNPDLKKMRAFEVVRGAETRLVRGGTAPKGPRTRSHKAGAAATVVDLASIYVHTKMMIVDDVFVSIGSANLNRRGLFSDGEINAFSVPQALKTRPDNPAAALRRQLWAEMLDLPLDLAAPLLEDPVAAGRLFDRSPLAGNRFLDIDAAPSRLLRGAETGDGLVSLIIQLALFTTIAIDQVKLFDGVIDPTTALETG